MTLSAYQIANEFPEFAKISAELIAAKLRDADAMTAADYGVGALTPEFSLLFGSAASGNPNLRELRVKYLACELLVLSPAGEFARLDPSKESDGARSLYERQRLQLDRSITMPMVI